MLVALAYCQKDAALARKLAEWIAELGGAEKHTCLLATFKNQWDGPMLVALRSAFGKVEQLQIPDKDPGEWPSGPNLFFRRIARQIEATTREPWLWMEPDAVPVSPSWLDDIEAAYKVCAQHGKPFMGVRVQLPGIVPHMSGIAVYPGNAPTLAPLLVTSNRVAFDVNSQSQVLPQMAETDLIQHDWRPESVDLNRLHPRAVIYHQDKTGKLIDLLRSAMVEPAPHIAELLEEMCGPDAPEEHPEVKRYRKDHPETAKVLLPEAPRPCSFEDMLADAVQSLEEEKQAKDEATLEQLDAMVEPPPELTAETWLDKEGEPAQKPPEPEAFPALTEPSFAFIREIGKAENTTKRENIAGLLVHLLTMIATKSPRDKGNVRTLLVEYGITPPPVKKRPYGRKL